MVQLIATDSLKTKLNALADVKNDGAQLPLELLEAIQAHLDAKEGWIEHKVLARIARWNKTSAHPKSAYTLRELIRGSEVYIEPPVVTERSPELEAILAPIRLAQEQATYASYLSSSHASTSNRKDAFDLRSSTESWDFRTASHPSLTVKQEWDAVRRELSVVANVLASMAAVSTAVWWAAGNMQLAQKTLLALFGAIGIAAIEGFLYVRFFQRSGTPQPSKRTSVQGSRHAIPRAIQSKM